MRFAILGSAVFAAAVASIQPSPAAGGDGVPAINVVPSCRAGASIGVGLTMETCLATEASARDQLAKSWNQFPPADRVSCVKVATTGGGGSYTALLTCLEVKRDARNLTKQNPPDRRAGR
jgi:hypothetical protein